jgi:hypothetical protein
VAATRSSPRPPVGSAAAARRSRRQRRPRGGGGGAGGPSIGIFKGGSSTATVTGSTIEVGTGGAGGPGGGPSPLLVGPPAGIAGEQGNPGVAMKIYPQP